MEEGRLIGMMAVNRGNPTLVNIETLPENATILTVSAVGAPAAEDKFVKPMDYVKAIEILKKVIKIDAKNIIAWFGLGSNYTNMEEYSKAIESFNKVLELEVDSELDNADAWYKIGYVYFDNGEYEKAEKAFQKILEIDQNNYKANQYLEEIKFIKEFKNNFHN